MRCHLWWSGQVSWLAEIKHFNASVYYSNCIDEVSTVAEIKLKHIISFSDGIESFSTVIIAIKMFYELPHQKSSEWY